MTLYQLMLRMSDVTDARIFIEDRYELRLGKMVYVKEEQKWYLLAMSEKTPKLLRDYEVLSIQVISGDVYVKVSWDEDK